MTREIKFRAWDKKEKKMWPVSSLHSNGAVHVDVPRQINPVMLNKDEFELMQDTGLKDKNGKEIYEGDIVNGLSKELGGNITRFTYEIFWDNEWKGWGGKNGETRNNPIWGTAPWKNLEIIGNIYENPELLNQ